MLAQIEQIIPVIPNYPKQGINFRDINRFLNTAELRDYGMDKLASQTKLLHIDAIVGLDSRGFFVAQALSERLNCGWFMARKPGKLPPSDPSKPNVFVEYKYEYSSASIEIQPSMVKPGSRILIADDVLVSGGTIKAAAEAIRQCGGIVAGAAVVINIDGLNGKQMLKEHNIPVVELLTVQNRSESHIIPETSKKIVQIKSGVEDKRCIILAFPSMVKLANEMINSAPGFFQLVNVDWNYFPDGYPNISFGPEPLKRLCNRDVIYLGDMHDKSKLMEQLSLLIAVSRHLIKSLRICFPYFAPGTMERVDQPGMVATAETYSLLISNALNSTKTGAPVINIFDIHALCNQFYFNHQNLIYVGLSMIPQMILRIRQLEKDLSVKVTICFGDDGANKRFSKYFLQEKFPLIVCSKERCGNSRFIKIKDYIGCTSETKFEHIVIVDDLVQSGSTLIETRNSLMNTLNLQSTNFSCEITHAVFPNASYEKFARGNIYGGDWYRVFVSDSIPEIATKIEKLGQETFEIVTIKDTLIDYYKQDLELKPQNFITVYVASTNPDKLNPVKLAFEKFYPFVNVIGVECESGVPGQPIGEGEIERGARNRMLDLQHYCLDSNEANKRYTFCVAIESGLVNSELNDIAFVAIYNSEFGEISGYSTITSVPQSVMEFRGKNIQNNNNNVTVGEQCVQLGISKSSSNWHKDVRSDGCGRDTLIQQKIENMLSEVTDYIQILS